MVRDLVYAQSHRHGCTYQGLWLPSRGALRGNRNVQPRENSNRRTRVRSGPYSWRRHWVCWVVLIRSLESASRKHSTNLHIFNRLIIIAISKNRTLISDIGRKKTGRQIALTIETKNGGRIAHADNVSLNQSVHLEYLRDARCIDTCIWGTIRIWIMFSPWRWPQMPTRR